jgi:hypothetical protein
MAEFLVFDVGCTQFMRGAFRPVKRGDHGEIESGMFDDWKVEALPPRDRKTGSYAGTSGGPTTSPIL